jgi:hypothetical protein
LSLITALLFYFGYAASRAQYRYFGIDVDTIGLSTQDFVMRSPQVLLAPLLGLLLIGLLVAVGHAAVRRRVTAAQAVGPEAQPEARAGAARSLRRTERARRAVLATGFGLLLAGALLLVAYPLVGEWIAYALVTPLLMAAGAALAGYGFRLAALLHGRNRNRRTSVVATWLVLTASVFWATATLAEASGRGLARDTAQHLDRLPGVILDTTERLYLTSPGVEERALPVLPGQTFLYRYRHLRLLIEGSDRLFLVPDTWSASDSTLVVPLNGSVRVQFRFVDDPP